MAVLTVMTDCTAMSQCDRGAVHDSHSVIGCCYLCIVQIADVVQNRLVCKYSLLNRLSLQTSLFLQSTGVSTISTYKGLLFLHNSLFSIA